MTLNEGVRNKSFAYFTRLIGESEVPWSAEILAIKPTTLESRMVKLA